MDAKPFTAAVFAPITSPDTRLCSQLGTLHIADVVYMEGSESDDFWLAPHGHIEDTGYPQQTDRWNDGQEGSGHGGGREFRGEDNQLIFCLLLQIILGVWHQWQTFFSLLHLTLMVLRKR